MATSGDRPQSDWLEGIGRNRQPIAYGLFGVGAAFAALALVLVIRYKTDYSWELFLCAVTSLVAVGAGMWQLTREASDLGEADTNRLFIVGAGGYTGLLISLFGLGMIIRWRGVLFGGMEAWQGEQGWTVWLSLGAFFLGLAVMFVSLMVARAAERTNPTLRRLIYGYNAVLSCLLLAAVLVVVNILGYLYLPVASDWTASGLYTLSSKSKSLLEGLDKPVKVYVLQTGRSAVAGDVRTLMENCQAASNKVQVEYVSVHRQPDRREELVNRYQLVEIEGILVVHGSEPDVQHQFIKEDDLIERRMTRMRSNEGYTFKGEDALISAIDYLAQGRSKPVVYFTQGNGELDLNDMDSNRLDRGLNALRERLQKGNHEVKGLQLGPATSGKGDSPGTAVSAKVPDDASVVVLAGPRFALPAETLAALTEYMNRTDPKTRQKTGRMVVLLDVIVGRDGAMTQTGLEKWLENFNVEVGNNRILTAVPDPFGRVYPTRVSVETNERLTNNAIATGFQGQRFIMLEARTVRPRAAADPAMKQPGYRAEELLLTIFRRTWAEPNLQVAPSELVGDLIKRRPEELDKLGKGRLPVSLAVSEAGGLPDIPEHAGMVSPDAKPRMVVFGDATLASNYVMAETSGMIYYDLFASSLAWLRERPQNIGIEAKKRDTYTMDQATNVTRLITLPLILMLAGAIGLGAGVWVVRRR